MLNEERIILMTKMAAYEQNEGKKNVAIGKYFKGDYIALQVLKSIISATIAFAVLFALYIFYDVEFFIQDIYKMDLISLGKRIVILYGITIVIYGLISYMIYAYRYTKARKNLKRYYMNLKKLNSLYQNQ